MLLLPRQGSLSEIDVLKKKAAEQKELLGASIQAFGRVLIFGNCFIAAKGIKEKRGQPQG